MDKNFFSDMFKNKKIVIVSIAALLGICLILLSQSLETNSQSRKVSENSGSSLDLYTDTLETRLESVVSNISGAGKAKVFITFDSTFETVYLSNARLDESKTNTDTQKKTTEKSLATLHTGTSNQEPVVVKQICPKISGVLIVCKGGENNAIKNNIINAVSTAFDISKSKIYVTGGDFVP